MLYMDYSATSPTHPEVIQTVTEVMTHYYGNPSSLHRLGVSAERIIEKSRTIIAETIGASPDSIIFTSGGTESNNLAIKGIIGTYRHRGRHIITTAIEHASVYECCKQLEQYGYRITYLQADRTGAVDVDELRSSITEETVLVSIMHVNNEVGRIQPIDEIGHVLRQYPRILFHVDAVQAIGKVAFRLDQSRIDLLSCSAHKIGGPKGIGFLYRRKGVELEPLFAGGGQEQQVRSGTENVPAIAGMAKAIRLSYDSLNANVDHMYALRTRLYEKISAIQGIIINGSDTMKEMAPHIIHISIPGRKPETIIHALEQNQIYISTQSACASTREKPSRILQAMGLEHVLTISGIRISISHEHTLENMDYFTDALVHVLQELPVEGKVTS